MHVPGRDFDYPEMTVMVEQFCMKYLITNEVRDKIKVVIKEMILNVLPMDREIVVHVDYSEKKDRVYIVFYQKDRSEAILADKEVKAAFEERVRPYCVTVHDNPDGNNWMLRLKIRNKENL